MRYSLDTIKQSYCIAIFDAISELRLISFLNLNYETIEDQKFIFPMISQKFIFPMISFFKSYISRYVLYYVDMYYSFRQALAIYG